MDTEYNKKASNDKKAIRWEVFIPAYLVIAACAVVGLSNAEALTKAVMACIRITRSQICHMTHRLLTAIDGIGECQKLAFFDFIDRFTRCARGLVAHKDKFGGGFALFSHTLAICTNHQASAHSRLQFHNGNHYHHNRSFP